MSYASGMGVGSLPWCRLGTTRGIRVDELDLARHFGCDCTFAVKVRWWIILKDSHGLGARCAKLLTRNLSAIQSKSGNLLLPIQVRSNCLTLISTEFERFSISLLISMPTVMTSRRYYTYIREVSADVLVEKTEVCSSPASTRSSLNARDLART